MTRTILLLGAGTPFGLRMLTRLMRRPLLRLCVVDTGDVCLKDGKQGYFFFPLDVHKAGDFEPLDDLIDDADIVVWCYPEGLDARVRAVCKIKETRIIEPLHFALTH